MISLPFAADRYAALLGRIRSTRGFTLIELMVTVVIISVLAALATPGILARVNNYKTRSAAEQIATTYRLARLRAMGRGSAVVVRYQSGTITVLEGRQGPDAAAAGCQNLPASSCTTPADRFNSGSDRYQTVETYETTGHTSAGASYTVSPSLGTTSDICFTPLGRAYSRTNLTSTFAQMLVPVTVSVTHASGGLARQVLVLPNGTARVTAGGP